MQVDPMESGIMMQMGFALTKKSEETTEKVVDTLMSGLPQTGQTREAPSATCCPDGVGRNVDTVA